MNQIKVSNVFKSYTRGKITNDVLEDINFSVDEGEFVLIIGPSGSGKTTLLYTISGLESCEKGEVFLFDKNLSKLKEKDKMQLRSHEISFVFQFYNLISNLTVYENILLSSVIAEDVNKEKIREVLKTVDMESAMDKYPSQLSGGQQQRVAIARALINNPKIIFADEPTGNLDYQTGLKIMELFAKLNKEYNKTIIMVTHNIEFSKYGTRVISMLSGRIIKDEKNR